MLLVWNEIMNNSPENVITNKPPPESFYAFFNNFLIIFSKYYLFIFFGKVFLSLFLWYIWNGRIPCHFLIFFPFYFEYIIFFFRISSSGTTEGRQKFVPFTRHSAQTTLQIFTLAAAYRSRCVYLSIISPWVVPFSSLFFCVPLCDFFFVCTLLFLCVCLFQSTY